MCACVRACVRACVDGEGKERGKEQVRHLVAEAHRELHATADRNVERCELPSRCCRCLLLSVLPPRSLPPLTPLSPLCRLWIQHKAVSGAGRAGGAGAGARRRAEVTQGRGR